MHKSPLTGYWVIAQSDWLHRCGLLIDRQPSERTLSFSLTFPHFCISLRESVMHKAVRESSLNGPVLSTFYPV